MDIGQLHVPFVVSKRDGEPRIRQNETLFYRGDGLRPCGAVREIIDRIAEFAPGVEAALQRADAANALFS